MTVLTLWKNIKIFLKSIESYMYVIKMVKNIVIKRVKKKVRNIGDTIISNGLMQIGKYKQMKSDMLQNQLQNTNSQKNLQKKSQEKFGIYQGLKMIFTLNKKVKIHIQLKMIG